MRGTKANPVEGEHKLYGFLTTEPNEVVAPIHPKAMPVLLTTDEEFDVWLRHLGKRRARCKGHLPSEMLRIVANGEKQDSASCDG